MKRMVKNGDLIDVEPDGSLTVAGKPVGGGGSDYTAGKNITISEANEISLPDNLNLLKSLSIYGTNESAKINLKQTFEYDLTILSDDYQILPSFRVKAGSGIMSRDIRVRFTNVDVGNTYQIAVDLQGFKGEDLYPFISRSRIPDVPSGDGTYILKATVSGGAVTYTWVAQ